MCSVSKVFQSSELPLLLIERWREGYSSIDVRVSRGPEGILVEVCGKFRDEVDAFFSCQDTHDYARS